MTTRGKSLCAAAVLIALAAIGAAIYFLVLEGRRYDYYLMYSGHDWEAEILINGILVCHTHGSGFMPVTYWTSNGPNTVRVLGTKSSESDSDEIDPFQIQILEAPVGNVMQKRAILEFSLELPEGTTTAEGKGEYLASMPFRWAWETATEVAELSAQDRQEILAILHGLQKALQERNLPLLAEYQGRLIADRARYYRKPESEFVEQLDDLQRQLNITGVEPWELRQEDEIDMRPCGRVLVVSARPDREAANLGSEPRWVLRARPTGATLVGGLLTELAFCRIQGTWRLLAW